MRDNTNNSAKTTFAGALMDAASSAMFGRRAQAARALHDASLLAPSSRAMAGAVAGAALEGLGGMGGKVGGAAVAAAVAVSVAASAAVSSRPRQSLASYDSRDYGTCSSAGVVSPGK